MFVMEVVKLLLLRLVSVLYIRYGYSGKLGLVSNRMLLMVGINSISVEKMV